MVNHRITYVRFIGIRLFKCVLCFCHHDGSDWILDFAAALIPFAEFRQQEVMENYEVELDPEVLDLLDTAIKKSHVCILIFMYFFNNNCEIFDMLYCLK